MIIFKVFVLAFIMVHAALANSIRGGTRSVNRPPAPEIYEAIPVSVVYENGSSRGDKSIKSGIVTTNSFKPVDKESVKSEPIVKDEIGNKNTSNLEPLKVSAPKEVSIVSQTKNKTENSESTPSTDQNQEQQIPVAVIYELESSFTIDTSPTSVPSTNRMQTNRRKVQRPPMAKKTIVDKEPLETRQTDHKENQNISKVDMQQQSVRVSENSQEGKEKQVVVKENHGTHRSENGQTFPKRDNSTRQHEFVPIIQSENVVFSHSGNFMYSYEGGDGTKAFENGRLKTYEDDNAGEAVSGGFSYMGKDGNEYSLSYTADENGYRPVGAHLPTPPPIPPEIARALAYLATKTTPEPVTESISSDED